MVRGFRSESLTKSCVVFSSALHPGLFLTHQTPAIIGDCFQPPGGMTVSDLNLFLLISYLQPMENGILGEANHHVPIPKQQETMDRGGLIYISMKAESRQHLKSNSTAVVRTWAFTLQPSWQLISSSVERPKQPQISLSLFPLLPGLAAPIGSSTSAP
jgi:hypothetical protein